MHNKNLYETNHAAYHWGPVDPEEDAADSGPETFPEFPLQPDLADNSNFPKLPESLNEELSEKIRDNPNKFIGCGG